MKTITITHVLYTQFNMYYVEKALKPGTFKATAASTLRDGQYDRPALVEVFGPYDLVERGSTITTR